MHLLGFNEAELEVLLQYLPNEPGTDDFIVLCKKQLANLAAAGDGAALLEDDAFEGEDDGDEDRQDGDSQRRGRSSEAPPKIEPFGADELRAIMVARRQRELERQRDELARRSVQQADLDIKLYREELQASARRRGGSNPRIYLSPGDDSILQRFALHARRLVVFSFTAASLPLRTSVTGKNRYLPVLIDDVRKNLQGPRCKNGKPYRGAMAA